MKNSVDPSEMMIWRNYSYNYYHSSCLLNIFVETWIIFLPASFVQKNSIYLKYKYFVTLNW